jgi:hypothetical protein
VAELAKIIRKTEWQEKQHVDIRIWQYDALTGPATERTED